MDLPTSSATTCFEYQMENGLTCCHTGQGKIHCACAAEGSEEGKRSQAASATQLHCLRAAADYPIGNSSIHFFYGGNMSRGAEHTTRQLTDQQLAQQNQLISQSNQEGGQDRSLLLPTIQSLLTSTGYTPQQQSDITQQSLGAANTAYDALRESAANHAAATNDTAAYGDLTAQLGREQAQTDASTAQQNQIAFANQAYKEQQAGLNALTQTYGIDTNLLGKAMGVPAELLNVRQRASSGSSVGGLGGLVGLGSSVGSLFG
jgi:hypothetical protein